MPWSHAAGSLSSDRGCINVGKKVLQTEWKYISVVCRGRQIPGRLFFCSVHLFQSDLHEHVLSWEDPSALELCMQWFLSWNSMLGTSTCTCNAAELKSMLGTSACTCNDPELKFHAGNISMYLKHFWAPMHLIPRAKNPSPRMPQIWMFMLENAHSPCCRWRREPSTLWLWPYNLLQQELGPRPAAW